MISLEERLSKYTEPKPNGCTIWTGYINPDGAPVMFYKKRARPVARVLYELNIGTIPNGMMIRRKCRDIKCVNPNHLYLYDSTDIESRIMNSISISPSGCWNWQGAKNTDGYGQLRVNGRHQRVHRLSYTLFVGRIPGDLLIRHKCDNPACVNPQHLETGTTQDNVNDRCLRGRSNVPRGVNVKNSKLTPELVREILTSSLPARQMAEKVGVVRQTIDRVRNGEAWVDIYNEVKRNG